MTSRINYVNLILGKPMELWGTGGTFRTGKPLWDKSYSIPPLAGEKLKDGVGDPEGVVALNPPILIELDEFGEVKNLDEVIQAMEMELHREWDGWHERQEEA